jgi:hypothetical protein
MAALPTSVKVFRSDMSGAPTLNGVAGAIVALLTACLNTGYGLKTVDSIVVAGGVATANISTGHGFFPMAVALLAGVTPAGLNGEKKVLSIATTSVVFDATGIADGTYNPAGMTIKMAPAGWDVPFTATNKAAFRSRNVEGTREYLYVDDTGTTTCRTRLYESMTDISTGVGPCPTDAQVSGGMYWPKSYTADAVARQWFVIATDKVFYIGVMPQATSGGFTTLMFGDIKSRRDYDPYCCCITGSNASTVSSLSTAMGGDVFYQDQGYSLTNVKYLSRGYQLIGTSKSVLFIGAAHYATSASAMYSGTSGYSTYPDPTDNSLTYGKMMVAHDNSFRGELPGLYNITQTAYTSIASYDIFTPTSGALAGRTLMAVKNGVSASSATMGVGLFDLTGDW